MNKESALKIIKNEKLSTEEVSELYWLLNKDQYKERPITIKEFIHSTDFVAKKWPNIFPLWKETLYDLFPSPFIAPYNEVLISAAAGAGKTVTATISIIYDMYKLGCLKDPCTFYGLTPDTQIIMAIFSATGSTAAVNWNEITTGIEACPWIMEKLVDKRGLEKKNGSIVPVEILPGVFIQTGSKFQHSMGKAIFDGLMDEAAFGGANMKDAQKSYNELSSRIKTRFATWGTKGNTPGQLFLISSPKEAGDFMQHRIEVAQKSDSKLTKVLQNIATWDADPRKDSDDKFTVFTGNENKEPCIYEQDADIPIEEMDNLLYVPMRYYEEFKKDLLISIMNYGGVTTTSDMALFKSVTTLNDAFVLQNPFKSDVVELPFARTDKTLMDFCNTEYFKSIRHPEYNRFIHIDAAFSTNTLDVYGLASSYAIYMDNADYTGKQDGNMLNTDLYVSKERMYFVDFAVGITAPKGQEVPLYKIQEFIEWLSKIGYPIASVSADTFQSKQTLQNLQVKGFDTENVSVDRTRDPYLFLRHLVYNKQVVLPKNEYLKAEMKKLRDDGIKVDHPSCFVGDTKIRLVDGRTLSILELMQEQDYKTNWVYTFNEKTQKIEPKRINHVFQSGITKHLVEVTLDNGEIITCTPEHRFMLRDGSYEEIQNLSVGTSLMPLYTKVSKKGLKGYRMYYEPIEDKWHYEHRSFGKPDKLNNIIHHCNYNKLDNCPTNLKAMTKTQHTIIHNNTTMDYKKVSETLKSYHKTMQGTIEYDDRNRKISKALLECYSKKPLSEYAKNKLRIKNFIKELENYYKVDYDKLPNKEKQSYINKYTRLCNPDYQNNLNNCISKAHKANKYANVQKTITQKQWITNGIETRYVFKSEPIPEGFWKGRTLSDEHKAKIQQRKKFMDWTEDKKQAYREAHAKDTSNRIWITNGIQDKYIKKDDIIPEGFTLGRSKVGKNHKIISIKFIEKPCKVYDLEIEDNHNFALDAGIIVHNSFHKDVSDGVAGSIWNCANSKIIINRGRVARKYLESGSIDTVGHQDNIASAEIMQYNQLKQHMSSLFKGM